MNRNNAIASLLLGGIIGITVSLTMFLVFADRTTPTQTYEKPNWFTEETTAVPSVTTQGGITIGGVVPETPENTLQSSNHNPNFTSTVNPQ